MACACGYKASCASAKFSTPEGCLAQGGCCCLPPLYVITASADSPTVAAAAAAFVPPVCAGVHACVSVGKFRQAEALLEPLKAAAGAVGRPMVSAYNLILKGHVAADNLEAARRTFAAMTSRGLAADAVTYNTLISGFVRAGDMARAQSLLRSMQVEGVVPDGWTFTTLALGYGRQGQLQEMHDVVQQMQQAGVSANSVSSPAWRLGLVGVERRQS